ncbi:MAG: acyl-CoA dehydrogenase family protein [Bacteroidales bacterium]|nr:acyl-CoA dehydrogenase family protein [Bacteroidales bacterium]MBN2756835.1 acyl-CoA dehydrogenase family protein [Bacteroidales bacterium]
MPNFYNDNKDLSFHLNHPLMKKIVDLKENIYTDKEQFDYAPLNFEDTMDSYAKVLEIVGEISGNIIAENAESVDKEGPTIVNNQVIYAKGTQQNYDALKNAGLIGMTLPRKYGGLNFSLIPFTMTAEIVTRADAGFVNIWGLQDCAETINEFASQEMKDEYLPRFNKGASAAMALTEPDAGSDLQAVNLKGDIKASYDIETDTWYLNGVKRFITNGDADLSLVLARSEGDTSDARGLSMFLYDRTSNAVKVRRIENKLGIKGSPTCELVYSNAPAKLIGDRKMGLIKYVMSLMNSARLGIGAQGVGLCEAAFREAVNYAKDRKQFGKAIIEFPAVYEMLSMMQVKTIAARSLLYETARYIDIYKLINAKGKHTDLEPEERIEAKMYQRLADIYTPLLKLFASEYANQNAYDAIQVLGGSGYMKDYPAERIYRDARITSIYEGTSQLQVVAAIRGVDNKGFLNQIKEYEKQEINDDVDYLKRKLVIMTDDFENAVGMVKETGDKDYSEFHARGLVEMAGNIIIGYILLINSNFNDDYKRYAEIFIKKGKSENSQKMEYIKVTNIKDIHLFRDVK